MHLTVVFFELGYFFNILGMAILVYNIKTKKHIEGISYYTQLIFTFSLYIKLAYFPFTILKESLFCWCEFLSSLFLSVYLMKQLMYYKRLSFMKEKNFYDYRINHNWWGFIIFKFIWKNIKIWMGLVCN